MIKILTVFGTRPEVIKMAPVIKKLREYPDKFICRICITAQHREMIDPLLKLFSIKPDYDLNIMEENQSLEHITNTVLTQLGGIIRQEKPDYLLVQGDTTTAMAASLAAFYQKIKVAHVEAGLRTWDKLHPYPEEINRKIIDAVSDLCFAHTEQAKQNLLREGVAEENIEVTGNTVIDALFDIAGRKFDLKGTVLENIPFNEKKVILVTVHRRENFGQPLINICNAIEEIASRYSDVYIVYPVHLNPNVQKTAYPILDGIENVLLIEPLDYEYFVQLMKRSYLILTDSGGLQEESPSLRKPVLVLREVTERPEAVEAGAIQIVGTQPEKIIEKTINLLEDKREYERMSKVINPYGDGKASDRIVACLLKETQGIINETSPKVSIVLPTYNGAKYIWQSIDSCLNQTYKNIELIIVDDGSTDETSEIIKSYKDKRIKYLRHEKNKGLPHALNTGFANATGEYLTWTSHDNYYAKEAIEKMISFLRDRNYSFVYCDFYRFKDENPSNLNIVKLPDVLTLENHNDVGACFLYSRGVYEVIGDYDPDATLAEDYDYWIRVSKKFSMYHLAEPLYSYRECNESLSLSRFYEVRVVDILVRVKNGVLDIDLAINSLVSVIAQKYPRYFGVNKFICKILFSRKINKIMRDFKMDRISFEKAKLSLNEIINSR